MKYYSNEIVFRGHPDKVCDQISAAILDACLEKDLNTRAGIEVAGGNSTIFVTGELTTKAKVNIEKVVRRVLKDVGYTGNYKVIVDINSQSPDIAQGVNTGGAGDQGMMFGYACNDNKEMLPTAMIILQKLAEMYDTIRKNDKRFLSDGKAQITGIYDDDFNLIKIKDFVISYQNTENERKETDEILRNLALKLSPVPIERILINPTGRFKIGGFEADAGLTGRKIVVDSYQSFANVGGGCLNGKDPSKVDLSGAYKARDIAIDYLEKMNLKWCQVQLSYSIGEKKPLAIYIETDKGVITDIPDSLYVECEPQNIIKDLNLLILSYEEQAKYGHFTRKIVGKGKLWGYEII